MRRNFFLYFLISNYINYSILREEKKKLHFVKMLLKCLLHIRSKHGKCNDNIKRILSCVIMGIELKSMMGKPIVGGR